MGLQRNALNLMHGSFNNLEKDHRGKPSQLLTRQLSNMLRGKKEASSQNRWR